MTPMDSIWEFSSNDEATETDVSINRILQCLGGYILIFCLSDLPFVVCYICDSPGSIVIFPRISWFVIGSPPEN